MVIGLGNVGYRYDCGTPPRGQMLTHCRAMSQHPGFTLLGAVDLNDEARADFEREYGLPAARSLREFGLTQAPSVLVVSTPTPTHLEVLAGALEVLTPQVVLMEKPLAPTAAEARIVIDLCRRVGVRLFVNYVRRAYPAYQEVKKRLNEGAFQGPFRGVVWYSGELINMASHMVNLLEFWFGESLETRLVGRPSDSAGSSPGLWMRFSDCVVELIPVPQSGLSLVGMDLIGTNGRLVVEGPRIECFWQQFTASGRFASTSELSTKVEQFGLDWLASQYMVAEELALELAGSPGSLCTGAEALATLKGLESWKESA